VIVVRLPERIPLHPFFGGKFGGYQQIFRCIEQLNMTFDYIMDLDLDEYLYLGSYKNIQDMITFYQPFDILMLNWLMMGNNQKITRKNDNLLSNFNRSHFKLDGWGKSIAKYKSIYYEKYCPHLFSMRYIGFICKNALNEPCNFGMPIPKTEQMNQQMHVQYFTNDTPKNKKQKDKQKQKDNTKQKNGNKEQKDNKKQKDVAEDIQYRIVDIPVPCVFHYSIQDIETFIKNKVNATRCRKIDGELKTDYLWEGETLEVETSEIKNEQWFTDFLDVNEYQYTLQYYQKYNHNDVENNLLFLMIH